MATSPCSPRNSTKYSKAVWLVRKTRTAPESITALISACITYWSTLFGMTTVLTPLTKSWKYACEAVIVTLWTSLMTGPARLISWISYASLGMYNPTTKTSVPSTLSTGVPSEPPTNPVPCAVSSMPPPSPITAGATLSTESWYE
eukprot:3490189-Rhodomonas_salina.7